LSDRVHAAGDLRAHQRGWDITKTTGRLGFEARSYRDRRFEVQRQQLSVCGAHVDERDHFKVKTGE